MPSGSLTQPFKAAQSYRRHSAVNKWNGSMKFAHPRKFIGLRRKNNPTHSPSKTTITPRVRWWAGVVCFLQRHTFLTCHKKELSYEQSDFNPP